MRNTHCMSWNMGRILKKLENETQSLQDLEYGERPEKREKRQNTDAHTHTHTHTHMVGPGIW